MNVFQMLLSLNEEHLHRFVHLLLPFQCRWPWQQKLCPLDNFAVVLAQPPENPTAGKGKAERIDVQRPIKREKN